MLAVLLCATVLSMPRLSTDPWPFAYDVIEFFSPASESSRVPELPPGRVLARVTLSSSIVTADVVRAVRASVPTRTGGTERVLASVTPPLPAT
jgi:hypothetical protein